MYKIYAFLKRNPSLSHDEYRAGHVGYHCGQSRRLKNIRGYLVNVWANEPLRDKVGPWLDEVTHNAPDGFLDIWDGFPEVFFDDRLSWTEARTVEPTRAMADGLVIDPDWDLGDSPHLFRPSPDDPTKFCAHHLHMLEYVALPVHRPEFKLTKIMHFFKRRADLEEAEFTRIWAQEYLPLAASMPNLRGYIGNLRDSDQEAALHGFFAPDDWVFTAEGSAERQAFCSLWDGASELFFNRATDFAEARQAPRLTGQLDELERELFAASWYVEVDENLIVNPNRDPAPGFYFR